MPCWKLWCLSTSWGLTIDCAHPRELAAFWAVALGYVEPPPPEGFASWERWLVDQGVPEEEWADGAFPAEQAGVATGLSFMRVPEPKTVKNRVHVDVKVSGGRDQPADLRRKRMQVAADRLVAAGGVVQHLDEYNGTLDHIVMTDPEDNEFCVVCTKATVLSWRPRHDSAPQCARPRSDTVVVPRDDLGNGPTSGGG